MLEQKQTKENQHKELKFDLFEADGLRPTIKSGGQSRYIARNKPVPVTEDRLQIGPGYYNWENAADKFGGDNSNKHVPLFNFNNFKSVHLAQISRLPMDATERDGTHFNTAQSKRQTRSTLEVTDPLVVSQLQIKNKFSNAYSGIDFSKHVEREKVSYMSKLYEKLTLDKQEQQHRLELKRWNFINQMMDERRRLGSAKYDEMRNPIPIKNNSSITKCINNLAAIMDKTDRRSKKMQSDFITAKQECILATNKFIHEQNKRHKQISKRNIRNDLSSSGSDRNP